jgi:hypothetical protein
LFKGAAGTDDVDEFFQRAKTKAKSAALAVESQRQSEALTRPQQKSALQLALEGAGASPDDAASFLNREKNHEPIRAWVPNTPAAVVKRAVEVVLGKNVSFAQVTALLTRNGQLRNYDQKKVLDWVMSYGLTNVADALENTQTETSTAWVETWLTTGATAQSSTTFKKLVRLQARITGSAAGLRVFQRDVEYVSSLDPPSRTGFLSYDFGGDDVELHTHWNVTKKKVASIHVKEGADKSTEINQWSFFGPISAAVVAAHNTATGNLAATTDPPGEQLTL